MGEGRTHLLEVTELPPMFGSDPTTCLPVLYGFGRCRAGRAGGGVVDGPTAQGLGEGGGGGGVGGQQQ